MIGRLWDTSPFTPRLRPTGRKNCGAATSVNRPPKITPMFEQYFELKRQAEDAIVFFRMGDFYEMFFEDAETAAPILDLVLTARGKGGDSEAPMCGVPFHSAEQYIAKLIRNGFRVAIGEQVEDPSQAKGLVRREIVRIITPGTAVDGIILDRDSCYLLSVAKDSRAIGAAWLDVSTGDFFVTRYESMETARLEDDLVRFAPREVILPREQEHRDLKEALRASGVSVTLEDEVMFDRRSALDVLTRKFGTQNLRGFGLEDDDPRVAAAGAALDYAQSRHKRELDHVRTLRLEESGFLGLDAATLRNLEVFEVRESDGSPKATLWGVMNATRTAMGGRMLRRWMARPLCDRDAIFDRHDAVAELMRNGALLDRMSSTLASIADLERIIARVTLRSAGARECLTLSQSLRSCSSLSETMAELSGPLLQDLGGEIDPCEDIIAKIEATLDDAPPQSFKDGGVIREGVHPELDELRSIARDSKAILLKIEQDEKEKTGISNLKVRFNSVFGYYLEVSKTNLSKVPEHYIRKQTLTNAERYITPELKEIEEKILGAEERSISIEQEIFNRMLDELSTDAERVLLSTSAVARIDVLTSFASVALRRRYVRPQLAAETVIDIRDGRHPVVEAISTERFIPNDTCVRIEENGIQIITGPNMGGKSTYLRQVALIVLMNQIGSFVPAGSASLGLFDRIFTRVGASDNLARGESTFMVEMQETANILNNATSRSLIILDEVGRGTATFDGLSLAWAIVEYLHDTGKGMTLFATHYHEITDLSQTRERVANFSLAVKEWKDQIIFLRKVVKGAADKSYGIQVAKLAGIPGAVTERAKVILETLERKERDVVDETRSSAKRTGTRSFDQLPLFGGRDESELVKSLRELDLDTLSPIEALNLLHDLKRKTGE
ncbi:MAG: DNA mismatch repair protein MutS [Acidobacteria bacterium]|nr:DNA mismatch repair protein MutS [Acidobacteriota bacterium]